MLRLRWATRGRLLAVLLMGAGAPSSSAAWTAGDTLYLRDVLEMVVERDAAVRASKARVSAAAAEQMAVEGYFDPSISLDLTSSRPGTMSMPGMPPGAWNRSIQASWVQRTPWGLSVRSYLDRSPGIGSGVSTTMAGIGVSVPVLRLGRRSPQHNAVRTARLVANSAEYGHRHVLASELFTAAIAYWDLSEAAARLAIVDDAAERAADVVWIVARLTGAGERAEADLRQVEAFASDRQTERARVRQGVWDAASRIAVLTDRSPAEFIDEQFPRGVASSPPLLGDAQGQEVARRAIEVRADLREATLLLEAERSRAHASAIALLPEVSVEAAYDRFLPTVDDDTKMPDRVEVGVTLRSALSNRSARGRLRAQRAREREAVAFLERARAEVRIGVMRVLAQVRHARQEVQSAEAAEAAHRIAVENERRKLEAGFATVLDVILAEDRLTNARLASASARFRLARAFAEMSFETGDLVTSANESPVTWERRLRSGGEVVRTVIP